MYKEITMEDDVNATIRKSSENMKEIEKKIVDVWHDLQEVDMTNGDRNRLKDWIINLFLEEM